MIECEYPGCDRLATSTRVNADGYLVASSPPTCREHEGSIAPTDDSAEPLSDEESEFVLRMRGHLVKMGTAAGSLAGGHSAWLQIVDKLTARVTELEGVLFTANEDKDEWRQSAEAWERSAKERLERAAAAEARVTELEVANKRNVAWQMSESKRANVAIVRAEAAEHRIEELTAERDTYRNLAHDAHDAHDAHGSQVAALRAERDRLLANPRLYG